MYVDNALQSLVLSHVSGYDIKASLNTGGVFMMVNVKTVTISSSTF
jgi:hypothetical protein